MPQRQWLRVQTRVSRGRAVVHVSAPMILPPERYRPGRATGNVPLGSYHWDRAVRCIASGMDRLEGTA
ncbi:hypothetical protein IFJ82_13685 [Novacetimonas hansenii]|uniref:Uncharacterized protein n=1 Tax=Novacetimonas hansenii TaxID=436 RepID=A0AAW5ESS4_NOVHA|nr:hypothetical protein [Novacetimonas hansenii]MCJ8353782.1 hypothetical protein [Novacetimonas hansenii]QOF94888.1 hypothetical protein IFJ82_13685 [Novacetimonas hansenii]